MHADQDGLTADDHTHYSLVDGTRAFTGPVGGVTPVASTDLATKEYVDLAVGFKLDYFLTNTASDIGGYYKLLDGDTGEAESTFTLSLAGAGTHTIATFATEPGDPGVTSLSAGVYSMHFHAERTAGTRTATAYWTLSKRVLAGTETLLMTSETSAAAGITSKAGYDLHASLAEDVDILTTDRLVLKVYIVLSATPSSATTVVLYAEGTTDSHISVAIEGDVLNQVYLRQDGTKPLTAAWDAGSWQIRAETFQSDVATGTAPFTVASTTVVTNLNANLLGGNEASAFATSAHLHDGQTLQNDGIQSDASVFVINESGGDYDFRIEGDTEQNLFFLDAGTDRVGFGTETPSSRVSMQGTKSTATLGSELVTNGTFASDLSGWTAGANWSWSGGTAAHTTGSAETLTQNISVTSGATYLVSFTVTGTGNINPTLGAVALVKVGTQTYFGSGTHYRTLVAGASGSVAFTITPDSNFVGTIDNVSVKAVTLGSALPVLDLLNSDGTVGVEMRSGGTTGLYNLFAGKDAGRSIIYANGATEGTTNVGLGDSALYKCTTGYGNVAIGKNSLYNLIPGYQNLGVGSNTLYACTSGFANAALGANALTNCTTGAYNLGIGVDALRALTTGQKNTSIGQGSLYKVVSGSNNSAIGDGALYNCTGSSNTAIGLSAGYTGAAVSNGAFLGYYAGYYQTTSNQVAIDSISRSTSAGEDAYSLIRGTTNASLASQLLWFNAGEVRITPNAASGEAGKLCVSGYPAGHSLQKISMYHSADGTFLFNGTTDTTLFKFDQNLEVTGNIVVSGTVDGVDVSAIGAASHTQGTDTGTTATTFTVDSDAVLGKIALTVAAGAADKTLTLTNAALTDNRTITFPDSTGTVALTGAAPTAHAASHVTGGGDVIASAVAGGNAGLMTGADKTKLDGIEAAADVTDATNVAAAGAVMEGDTTTAAMSFVIDEDNMASNLSTKVPTQQSVKAYVDTAVAGSGAAAAMAFAWMGF